MAILGSKLWLLKLFGSSIPWWDQWDVEAAGLYIPYFEGRLTWSALFAYHCEHRFFVNRVAALVLLLLNGQWDPLLSMTLNALVTAITGTGLAWIAWNLLRRKYLLLISVVMAIVWALPYSWEGTLLGFINNYWLVAFAVFSLWLLLSFPAGSARWLVGLALAALSFVTAGSGFFIAIVIATIMLSRLITNRGLFKINFGILVIGIIGVLIGLLVVFSPSVGPQIYHAKSLTGLVLALCRTSAWPNMDRPMLAFINWLPVIILACRYFVRKEPNAASAEVILGLALWVMLQNAAMAYARGGIIGAISSRHLVITSLALPANFLALLLLFQLVSPLARWRFWLTTLTVGWLCASGYGLWSITYNEPLARAREFKHDTDQCIKNVKAFVHSGNLAHLTDKPSYEVPFPDPNLLGLVLTDPAIRDILPECVSESGAKGPLSRWNERLLSGGLYLFIIGSGLMVWLVLLAIPGLFYRLIVIFAQWKRNDWTWFYRVSIGLLVSAGVLSGLYQLYQILSPVGLVTTYYRGINFEEPICRRTIKKLFMDYENKPPAFSVPRQYYSARLVGYLHVTQAGEYTFYSQSDDGIRLFIGNELVIDNWQDQSWASSGKAGRLTLIPGRHSIRIEYYNRYEEGAFRIRWSGGQIPPNTILAKPYLFKHR